MDKTEPLKQLLEELKSMEQITSSLINKKQSSQLDIDYLLEKTRKLYDHILALNKPEISTKRAPKEPIAETKIKEKQAESAHSENYRSKEGEEKTEAKTKTTIGENQEKPQKNHKAEAKTEEPKTKKKEEISPIEETKEKEKNRPKKDNNNTQTSKKEIVADKYENEKDNSVADHFLSAFGSSTLGEELGKGKILNIKAGLGINDRYTFIQELFDGNSEGFSRAVNEINELETFKAALAYIDKNFDWSTGNPFAVDFVKLIGRKFL